MPKSAENDLESLPIVKREELKALTTRIKVLLRASSNDLIKIGEHITKVRNIIPRRHFTNWLKSATPYSRSHGYRLMNAYRVFGKSDVRRNIEPSALYLLSQPSTPADAQEYAANIAKSKEVSYTDAIEIVRVHKANPEEVAKHASRLRQGKERYKELAWDEMEKAVKKGMRVRIEFFNEDDNPYFYVTASHDDPSIPPKYVPGPMLTLAMLEALGKMPQKLCNRCENHLSINLFSKDSTREDGISIYCQKCENLRHKMKAARDREQRASQEPAAVGSLF